MQQEGKEYGSHRGRCPKHPAFHTRGAHKRQVGDSCISGGQGKLALMFQDVKMSPEH